MPPIKLISFDADQTLFDFDRTLREALATVAHYLTTSHNTPCTAQDLRSTRDHIAKAHQGQAIDMLELRRLSFLHILADHPKADAVTQEAMALFKQERFGKTYLYDNVQATLAQLAQHHTLAVLTNGNSDPDRTPLKGRFDHVVMGEKFPYEKPDPRIFHHLFAQAQITDPAQVLHIGDSLEHDVAGANGVGAKSVWFNPDKAPNTTGIQPMFEIQNMADLLPLLNALNRP